MSKHSLRRILSLLLAVLLVCTLLPAAVLAAENPEQPAAPTDEFLRKLGSSPVRLSCVGDAACSTGNSGLLAGSYSVGEVKENADGGYTCDITVKAEQYVDNYNASHSKKHILHGDAQKILTLTYDGAAGEWTAGGAYVRFDITCSTAKPDKSVVGQWRLKITCSRCKDSGEQIYKRDLRLDAGADDGFTIGEVKRDEGGYYCEITVKAAAYISIFSDDSAVRKYHALAEGEEAEKTFKVYHAEGSWPDGYVVIGAFNVTCKAQPPAPEKPSDRELTDRDNMLIGGIRASFDCKDHIYDHGKICFLTAGDYTVGEVYYDNESEKYRCKIETSAEKYLSRYNSEVGVTHVLTGGKTGTIEIFYNYNPIQKGWTTAYPVFDFEVSCETETYTVTYTDGADGKVFKDRIYDDLLPGTATPGFGGAPERENYVFAGWTPEIADTVSGDVTYTAVWTPETYAVSYELNGGTAQGNPESYTVESGSFTLKNPARNGYTFTGWSGTGLDGENNMTVTVETGSTGDRTYTAHWRYNTAPSGGSAVRNHTIRASASAGGSISPSGSVSVGEGGSRMFTFAPDKGYALCNVLVDGKEIGAAESYTFQNVRSGHTVEAVFMKEDGNPNNGVTASGKPAAETFKESTPEERREKLEAARKANGDAAAWLYIPAAEIDMPVLQTKNNAFYLRMGADKEYAPWGSVYADCRAELESRETLGANTAIFGASAADGDPDGECFSKLFRYLDAEFVEENPYIYLTLADGEELVFRIGACFVTDTEFDYIRPAFETDEEWKAYLETVEKKNLFAFAGAALEKGDTLLTLTTYSEEYDTDKTGEQRFAVVAKLLPDGEDTAAYTVKNATDPELP